MALAISGRSNGCFDVTVGSELVRWGMLPKPASAAPRRQGCWRDIELRADGKVSFHRPVWIDLGGIAKGYAVDRAIHCVRASGVTHALVNAGGDIRVHGREMEHIVLDLGFPSPLLPVLELAHGSVASSSGHLHRKRRGKRLLGPHVHGADRSAAPTGRFVCVLAKRCVVADALTKIVIAEGLSSRPILRQFGASAYLHDLETGWHPLGEAEAQ